MRHLYMNGGVPAPRVADPHRSSTRASTRAANTASITASITVRSETIVRTVCALFAALIVASSIPLGAQLGAQEASRANSPTNSRANSPTKLQAPPQTQAAASVPAAVVPPVSNDSYNLTVPTPLRDAPSSAAIGQLQKSANVEVIARDRGWSRVRIDGWVPDSVLVPADTAFRANLSAADLRADPVGTRGKMVIWNVEFLALQTADPLRHGLADEEPYILARGPNSENALLYLVVPPSLMGTARALQPLAKITVTARVRDGRSDPVGIPILDIQTLRRIR